MIAQAPFEVGDLVTYDPNGFNIWHLGVGIVYEKQHVPFSAGHVIRVLFVAKQCRRVFRDNTDILSLRESAEVLKVYVGENNEKY